MFQVPVWGASPRDSLRGVWGEDQPGDDKVALSEAGVERKSLLHPFMGVTIKLSGHICDFYIKKLYITKVV